jgi:hypothetical protein
MGFTATANGDGTLSLASDTTGSTSSMEIVSATATDAGGADTLANTSGINTVAASAGADAGAAKILSFQVDIDGSGTPTTVTIDQSAVAAVGNNDNTIDDVAELQSIIDAQLGTGVTVGTDTTTGAITLTSATSGSSSSVAITNTAVTGGLTNTSGISDTTASGTGTPPMAITSGQTLSVQVGDDATTAKTITFGTGANQVDTLDELNAQLADVGAKASLDADGKLKIETTNDHEADKLVLGGTMVDTASTTSTTAIFDFSDTASATSSAVTDTDQTKRSNYKNDYNDLRDQIGKLAKDASYNGINLLAGDDLKVVFNEDGSSKLDISGVDVMDTLGLSDLVDGDFLDSSSIDAVISKIDDAMSNLDGLSSKFGSQLSVVQTRQDFTKDMIGTLDDGANLLTAADTNEEAANLATLQTRQSLIVSSLSISTQQEQNILQLLR